MMRSIRAQIMLFFSLLIIVPIIVSCIHVYYALQNYLKDSYVRQQQQSIGNLASELIDWRFNLEDLSLQLFGDRRVQDFLLYPNSLRTGEQVQRATDFRQALQMYGATRNASVSIYVVRTNGTVYGEEMSVREQDFIRSRLASAGKYVGLPVWEYVEEFDSIALYRQINNNETDLNRPIGYLFLLIDKSEISKIIDRYSVDPGQHYAIFNKESTLNIRTDAGVANDFLQEIGERSNKSSQETIYGGEPYVTFAQTSSDWSLVSWITKREILQPARDLFFGILFIAVVLLLFCLFMVLFLSHRITKPLNMIQRKMKLIGEGLFVFKVPVVRNDEVGELASAMNRMSDEIVSLIQKNREEEAKRRLLQLQTLEYQINPHFLYNTLDSVNMLARKHKDPIIADIVTYLSRLFRIGLNQGRELMTVADEVRHVTYYLKIQEIRFAGQLFWDVQLDKSIEDTKIIKFILQPLVENSINHGIRKREESGHIHIRIWKDTHVFVLEVEDDGVGIEPDQLERVRQSLTVGDDHEEKEHGFGLRNVHQRIQLHYGEHYGLQIDSEEGQGTTVSVRLPISQECRK
ncbi:cache domain-containing sensor histidine kinase [Paenibacillus sp. sgz302251]|uniref:cache domain-containing sensor histidine kinase n=1 Tax=Paenibacillus sp. sgz302251 TaxID=3414493 RepID=UPI003C7BDE69